MAVDLFSRRWMDYLGAILSSVVHLDWNVDRWDHKPVEPLDVLSESVLYE